MKTILCTALLSVSLITMAQQNSAPKGEFINYEYSGKKEKITLQLPKGAEVKAEGKFVINGKNFHIEELDAKFYLEKGTTRLDTVPDKIGRDIITLSYLFPDRAMNMERTERLGTITDSQMRVSDDKEYMACWYTYNESEKSMITSLEGGKVIGDNILVVIMDDKVKAKSIEFKNQRNLIFEILDSAVSSNFKSK
nr:hypothetical protein [uncultured Flavobacterium sp.]